MRKHNLTHKSRKVLCCVLTAAGLMMAVTACGGNEDAGKATAQQNIQGSVQDSVGPSDGAEDVLTEESNAIFGQITAIDGDTLTLALAEQPSRADMEGTMQAPEGMPDGEQPGGNPEGKAGEIPSGGNPEGKASEIPSGENPEGKSDEKPSGENPEGKSGENPEGKRGEWQGGKSPDGTGHQMEMTLTGETKTLKISDSTIITVNGEEASAADLSVDDIVVVLVEGDTVNSISVGMEKNAAQQ